MYNRTTLQQVFLYLGAAIEILFFFGFIAIWLIPAPNNLPMPAVILIATSSVFGLALAFLPIVIGCYRGHRNMLGITFLTIVGNILIIPWFMALIMAQNPNIRGAYEND